MQQTLSNRAKLAVYPADLCSSAVNAFISRLVPTASKLLRKFTDDLSNPVLGQVSIALLLSYQQH
jgi:hypothetical protein